MEGVGPGQLGTVSFQFLWGMCVVLSAVAVTRAGIGVGTGPGLWQGLELGLGLSCGVGLVLGLGFVLVQGLGIGLS